MAIKKNEARLSTRKSKSATRPVATTVAPGGITIMGGEIWVIQEAGRSRRIVTSVNSTATIDAATALYEKALKNLADK